MKNKLKLLGIIAAVAVIGFSMVGCDNGNGGGGGGIPANLLGTWVENETGDIWVIGNGTIQETQNGVVRNMTFSVSGNNITLNVPGFGSAQGTFTVSGNTLTTNILGIVETWTRDTGGGGGGGGGGGNGGGGGGNDTSGGNGGGAEGLSALVGMWRPNWGGSTQYMMIYYGDNGYGWVLLVDTMWEAEGYISVTGNRATGVHETAGGFNFVLSNNNNTLTTSSTSGFFIGLNGTWTRSHWYW